MQELEPVERALVVTPHPDDSEFGCAGTTARLVSEGKEVFYVVATSGNKGCLLYTSPSPRDRG